MRGRSRASTLHRAISSHWAGRAGYASMHQGGVGKQEREADYHKVIRCAGHELSLYANRKEPFEQTKR